MIFLLHQENLSQYAAITLALVRQQFIIKLKFNLKQKKSKNVTKVRAPVGNQQVLEH